MKDSKQKKESALRRIHRLRARISGTAERPRLTVRRTLKHLYVQLVDDTAGKTLVAASDKDVTDAAKKSRTEIAHAVGVLIAEKAKTKKVSAVVFDRRDKKYHGRVKAVAEGAREGGLVF